MAAPPDGVLIWTTWCALVAVAWLLPTRTPPWATFYHEALTAGCFLAAGWWALLRPVGPTAGSCGLRSVDIGRPAILMAVLGVVPLLQAWWGLLVVPAQSFVYSSYLLAAFLAIVISRHAQRHSPWVLVQGVLAGLVIAALVSGGLALYQRLGLTWLGLMAPDPAWERASANLGQPNNLSTLFCLGLVGIWWGFLRRQIGSAVCFLTAGLLLVGICLTGSRTGLLALLVFPLTLAVGWRAVGSTRRVAAMAALAIWLMIVWTVLAAFPPDWLIAGGRDAAAQASGGYRPQLWAHVLEALAQKPWTGWGWNQILQARTEMASLHPDDKIIFHYAHNLVLDLLMWNGVPLGLAVVFLMAWWLVAATRRATDAEHWVLLAALAMMGVHALLEFPHAYLFFLLPAAVFVGTLDAEHRSAWRLQVNRWWMVGGLAAASVLFLTIVRDYQEIERVEVSWRLYDANIGRSGGLPKAAEPLVLRGLADADAQLRKRARADMPSEELARWREVLTLYPAAGGLARYAQAASLNGQPQEAEWALGLLCQFGSQELCTQARSEWLDFKERHTHAAPTK